MASTRLLLALTAALVLPALSCSDANIRDRARCDGTLNTTEETVDDAFDLDGDGYFDANSTECQDTYDVSQLDCNDDDSGVNPGAVETACNDLDDDCDEATIDAPDADEDGFTPCEGDCDDNQPLVGPEELEEICDGLDNDCDDTTLDGPDNDGDTYACDDCDDENDAVNPAQTELTCNGWDDDCNELTPDGDDFDNDGMIHCFDCDDMDPLRFPGNPEICEDGLDQDCDEVDAACPPPTWDGVWSTTPAVTYSCATGQVAFNFSSISVIDSNPSISFTFIGGTQPGTLSGTLGAGDTFSASTSIPGLCTEDYAFSGSFTGPSNLTGTLTATFTDTSGTGFGCFDCTNQTWNVNGTR
ncbi:MAG: putative metal-binding motif-containing protein [Deltaproteobacteria bacterium]|nr:putative metal-binding motif-containing protein [Deltaproteobacteria bacterium]